MEHLREALERAGTVYIGDDRETTVLSFLEDQRRSIGAAYQMANDVCRLSKEGVSALASGNHTLVADKATRIQAAMAALRKFNVPPDFLWQRLGEAGQEAVEFCVVCELHNLLFPEGRVGEDGGERVIALPSPDEMLVTPQAWLSGVIDATSELGKIATERMCRGDLTRAQHVGLLRRLLEITRTVNDFLQKFVSVPGSVLDINRRQGFGNTFRGKMFRIEQMLERNQLALLRMVQDDSK